VMMGGGPSAWAVEAHARAGLPVYATAQAAKTLNDELDKVRESGIEIVSDDEATALPDSVQCIEFRDFNLPAIQEALSPFGVDLSDLDAIAVAVFDHGDAPPNVSDRQFRFDYLNERIQEKNSLSSFAFLSSNIPPIMTRLQAVADSAGELPCPLIVMDTAPAAVLGASFDPAVAKREHKIITNIGNFHTLAFRMGAGGKVPGTGIEGVFEHHTGEIDLKKLESLLRALADSSLKHEDVFDDMGHGALMYTHEQFEFGNDDFDVVVTGPRRSMYMTVDPSTSLRTSHGSRTDNRRPPSPVLRPYFAAPFGDMMIAGCFGLLAATAEIMPELTKEIYGSMRGERGRGVAPWDNPS